MKKFLLFIVLLAALAYAAGPWLLTRAGEILVVEKRPAAKADAVVVLTTGVDYLPRLMQAAELYRQQQAGLGQIDLFIGSLSNLPKACFQVGGIDEDRFVAGLGHEPSLGLGLRAR